MGNYRVTYSEIGLEPELTFWPFSATYRAVAIVATAKRDVD